MTEWISKRNSCVKLESSIPTKYCSGSGNLKGNLRAIIQIASNYSLKEMSRVVSVRYLIRISYSKERKKCLRKLSKQRAGA